MPEHDAPQSRNEAILQNILGEHNELLEPQSRNEAILQAILYGDSYTEDAQSRIETLLLCILNGTTTDLEPLSRNEEILIAKINGGTYDKEPQSRIEELLIEWLNAFVEKTVTGAVCSFDDAIAGQPFISLSAEITPQQSGTGDPSPSNVRPINGFTGVNVKRTGINIWNEQWEVGGINTTTGQDNSVTDRIRSVGYIPVKPTSQYFCYNGVDAASSSNVNTVILCYDINKQYTGTYYYKAKTQPILTVPSDCYFVRFYTSPGYGSTYLNDISINYPSTDTAYHAYNGTTYSVTWQTEADTVYGGSIDLTTGVLTAEYHKDIFEWGNGSSSTVIGDNTRKEFALSEAFDSSSIASKAKCNIATWNGSSSSDTVHFYMYNDSLYVFLPNNTSASTQIEVLYPLATPQTYQLTSTEVLALLGVNNIYSNTGNTTVKYKARG